MKLLLENGLIHKLVIIIISITILFFTSMIEIKANEYINNEIEIIKLESKEKNIPVFYDYNIPDDHDGFKSYMSYKSITNKSSMQYKLQQLCDTNKDGFRMVCNRYVIAVGTGIEGNIGDFIDVYLENGCYIPCVIGDIKAPKHTDKTNIITKNNCCSEFIVSKKDLKPVVKKRGDVSYANIGWDSPVKTIRRYEINIFTGGN